ncbi:MAG: peptide deformylase [Hyphomicrobiaceae bacterium]|nr:peptide deformylase [Hyphomicrobiaceae bacterium]
MTKLEIITMPDPILRKTSESVTHVSSDLLVLLDDMLETMYRASGIGLAGIQVAVPKRVLVVDVSDHEKECPSPICMINPEILYFSERKGVYEEGCLSLPETRVEIERPSEITVSYIDRDESVRELTTSGLLSTVIQHEINHLDGKLIIDYLSSLKRDIVIRRLKKMARAREDF